LHSLAGLLRIIVPEVLGSPACQDGGYGEDILAGSETAIDGKHGQEPDRAACLSSGLHLVVPVEQEMR
jgi:hypothetical protein